MLPRALCGAVRSAGAANAMFATGNSQLAFLDELMTRQVDWAKVIVFHMDEYVGVGPDHPAGFGRYIRERIARARHPGAVHYVQGTGDRRPSATVRGPAASGIRSTCAAWASARTATSRSTTRRWPISTTRSM